MNIVHTPKHGFNWIYQSPGQSEILASVTLGAGTTARNPTVLPASVGAMRNIMQGRFFLHHNMDNM